MSTVAEKREKEVSELMAFVRSMAEPVDVSRENLEQIKDMAEHEKLKPFIDKYFKLGDIVKAHEYVDSGRKRGNVVIEIVK